MSLKARIKFGIFLVGIMVAVVVGIVGLFSLSNFIVYFQQGADPASIFRGHSLIIPLSDQVRWLPSRGLDGKEPKQSEREEMIAAYWQAWLSLERAHLTGDTSDLSTYWAGSAYDFAVDSISPTGQTVFATEDHAIELTFYSSDGSVIALKDRLFSMTQTINQTPITMRASATLVMTLDQGFWRIRQITLSY